MFPRLAIAAALVVLMPIAGATWQVNGNYEPNTPDDITSLRMWTEPDVAPQGMKVYFDAIVVDGISDANPNLGVLQSRLISPGPITVAAWLGVWKDCNQDGYIGLAESAAFEYKPELLLNDSLCPPGSLWNHHKWVAEFLHIGPQAGPSSSGFPRILTDAGSAVWGDYGRPNKGGGMYGCAPSAIPRGTLESTGTVLRHADCQLGYRVLPMWNALDGSAQTGLSFRDSYHPENDCDHALIVGFDLAGEDPCQAHGDPGLLEGGSSEPMFVIFDCSTNPDSLAPAVDHPSGSAWNGLRTSCFLTANAPLERDLVGNGGANSNPSDGKRRPDFHFDFSVGAGVGGFATPEPQNLGLTSRISSPWSAREEYGPPRSMGGVFRGTDFEPAGGIWMTFYAYVSSTTLQRGALLPPALTTSYGAEDCGDFDSGVHNGWDCAPDHWWNPAFGGVANANGRRPGSLYDLRDTDCYDGLAAEGSGMYLSLAPLSNDLPCPIV